MKDKMIAVASLDAIEDCIYVIREQKVMLDSDLAALYGVTTKAFNQAIRRNSDRLPDDFMFVLTNEEHHFLRSQFVTLKVGRGRHRKYRPLVFTEQGVGMLSGILRSPRAVRVHVSIMRAFVRMKRLISANDELAKKLEELENKLIAHDSQIGDILKAIRKLIQGPRKTTTRIGYRI